MEVVLETDRLVIRRLTNADYDPLVDLDNDPLVTRFITGGVPEFDRDMLDAWLAQYERWPGIRHIRGDREVGRTIPWLVPSASAGRA